MTPQYVEEPMRPVVVIAIMLTVIGCSNRADSTTTTASIETEPDRLIVDLNAAGKGRTCREFLERSAGRGGSPRLHWR